MSANPTPFQPISTERRAQVIRAGAGITVLLAAFLLYRHHHAKGFEAPELAEEPVKVAVETRAVPDVVPAYGLIMSNGGSMEVEVSIESSDVSKIRVGESATIRLSENESAPGRVTRLVPRVSEETGQGLAWIVSDHPKPGHRAGDFVWAQIAVKSGRAGLAIPSSAVLVRENKTWVIREEKDEKGKEALKPVPVEIGTTDGEFTEITQGLAAGDEVVSVGAVGYLYPDFKTSGGD